MTTVYRNISDLIKHVAPTDPQLHEALARLNRNAIDINAAIVTIKSPTIINNITNNVLFTGGVYPASQPPTVQILTPGSAAIGTSRKAVWGFYDTRGDDVEAASIYIKVEQTSNPFSAIIKKTGIHIDIFTMPDNGGDDSGMLAVQTGGGCGIAVYKVTAQRPAGYVDYWDSPQGAIECGTDGGSYCLLALPGLFGSARHADGVVVRQDHATSVAAAFRAEPGNGTFDTRPAIAISGRTAVGGALTLQTFQVNFNGDMSVGFGAPGGTHRLHAKKASADCNIVAERTGTNPSAGILAASADVVIVGAVSSDTLLFITGNTEAFRVDTAQRVIFKEAVILQDGALATTATDGFTHIPTSNGAPTGVPTLFTGTVPWVYDVANNHMYVYNGGSWKKTTVFA